MPANAAVSDSAVEFTADDLQPTGRDPVAAQHDIQGSTYTFKITDNRTFFFDAPNGAKAANSYVLTFDALGGASDVSLHSADIIRNDMNFQADDVTVDGNRLEIDLSGHVFSPQAELGVQLGFAITGKATGDRLVGDNGRDALYGLGGNDTLIGGRGGDLISGGTGSDTASYVNADTAVAVNLASARTNKGDAAGDTYDSIENLTGSNYNDRLYGDSGKNFLKGLDGNDVLSGGAGNDSLYGQDGNDKLLGGTGDDRLFGGSGADDVYGGTGKDIFFFQSSADSTVSVAGRDTIFDFQGAAGDKIHLVGIDADTTRSGNQVFDFIGTALFSGEAGELRYKKMASDTYIYGDLDGDRRADFSIHLDDAVTLQKGYFFL